MNFNVCDDKASNSDRSRCERLGWLGRLESSRGVIKNAQNDPQFHASRKQRFIDLMWRNSDAKR